MNSDNSARDHQAVHFQDAQVMYYQGQLERQRDAVGIAEMALSTVSHRMAGRRSAEDYGKTRRLLTAEEELILLRVQHIIVFRLATNPG